jgi:hypothetical protein
MNKIEKFEDIIAWQKARILTKEIGKADEVSRLVGGFMNYLRESELRGKKYK